MTEWKQAGTKDSNHLVATKGPIPTLVATFLEAKDAKRAVTAMQLAIELADWAENHSEIFVWSKDSTETLGADLGFAELVRLAQVAKGEVSD